MKRRPFMILPSLLLAIISAPVASRQAMPDGAAAAVPATLTAQERQEITARLGEALRKRYVFPDIGTAAAAKVDAARGAGQYDGLVDPGAFAARLSADVDAIAHDKHLRIWSGPVPLPPPPAMGARMPPIEGGISRADRLAGGIGYIEVLGFPPPGPFKRVLDRTMSGLADSRTLIVDVRRNGGGSPEAVAYLVSFLVAPDQPINDIVARIENTTDFTRQSYRSVPTPISFAGVPVYVLTSKGTFSGGEEFAYDVQALKRGTVIGEVTGGGANPTGLVALEHGFVATIPTARAENPVTRTNWEGRGVQPDVRVPATDALAAALERAGQKPIGTIEAASLELVFTPRSTPLPGSEAALRAVIAGYVSGKPDYDIMAPEQADRVRSQLPALQAEFSRLGELRLMTFLGPDMFGGDQYELHFAKGDRMMGLVLGPEGKILAVSTPMPALGRP